MPNKWREMLRPYYRKRCSIQTVGGEIVFYAFDAAQEPEGVDSLIGDHIGSREFLAERLDKKLGFSVEDAVMFGVQGLTEENRGLKNWKAIDGKPLAEALGNDVIQIESVLFYNSKTGDAFINEGGSFWLLPDRDEPKKLDKIGITLVSK
jgi:hypothetical protein